MTDLADTIDAMAEEIQTLQQRLSEVEAEREKMASFIEHQGYRRCDIPACNCGSYHGGHLSQRFDEIIGALEDADISTNGRTVLNAVKFVLAENSTLKADQERMREALRQARSAIGSWLAGGPDVDRDVSAAADILDAALSTPRQP